MLPLYVLNARVHGCVDIYMYERFYEGESERGHSLRVTTVIYDGAVFLTGEISECVYAVSIFFVCPGILAHFYIAVSDFSLRALVTQRVTGAFFLGVISQNYNYYFIQSENNLLSITLAAASYRSQFAAKLLGLCSTSVGSYSKK